MMVIRAVQLTVKLDAFDMDVPVLLNCIVPNHHAAIWGRTNCDGRGFV
jgi:hypothetical protein